MKILGKGDILNKSLKFLYNFFVRIIFIKVY